MGRAPAASCCLQGETRSLRAVSKPGRKHRHSGGLRDGASTPMADSRRDHGVRDRPMALRFRRKARTVAPVPTTVVNSPRAALFGGMSACVPALCILRSQDRSRRHLCGGSAARQYPRLAMLTSAWAGLHHTGVPCTNPVRTEPLDVTGPIHQPHMDDSTIPEHGSSGHQVTPGPHPGEPRPPAPDRGPAKIRQAAAAEAE